MEKKTAKIKQARPIAHSEFSRSPVTIIIPFHGQYEKVSSLIQSILIATKSNPYEICLVDDCSPNPEFIKELKDVPQLITLRTPEQLGFGGALKYGFDNTEQPWVIFLNSDCLIKDPNWMIEMGRSLLRLKEKNVRMVSARSNNPGEGLTSRLFASNFSHKANDYILEEGWLPLYCVMCHRELFQHIGGFVKKYPFGWYEDEELAFRMKHYGFAQAVCGKSWVHHHGSATFDAILQLRPEIANTLKQNRERCINDMQILSGSN